MLCTQDFEVCDVHTEYPEEWAALATELETRGYSGKTV